MPILQLHARRPNEPRRNKCNRDYEVPLQNPKSFFHSPSSFFRWLSTLVVLTVVTSSSLGNAQSYFRGFHNHNAELKEVQPTWVTPLVGTTPLLGRFVREEFVRHKMPGGS